MKRYDQNAFIVFVFLCGLHLLLSCSTNRHAETVTTAETRDTTHTHFLSYTTTSSETQQSELHDATHQADRTTGSLRIERDSAGRPVLFFWNTSAFMQSDIFRTYTGDGLISNRALFCESDSSMTKARNIQKEEKTSATVGASLEDYVGSALLLLVILYVIYSIIENLWRKRNK